MRTFYWPEIVKAATKYTLDPILVEAMVVQESLGNADSFRFERDFWNRLMKPQSKYKNLNPRRYSSSYGLMQCMWAVAVERGFPADLPPELLFVPETALDYGCRQLRMLSDWADKGWPLVSTDDKRLAVLASYNGGRGGNIPGTVLRNASYAKSVMSRYLQLTKEHTVA